VPRGAKLEEAALADAGRSYEAAFERRDLPELPAEPEWPDVLRRALLANGELEAAYFQWAAAVHRIRRAGSYPNTPLSIGFEQMFQSGTSFDDTSITIGPDAMENLAFPTKVGKAAAVALDDARAAGKSFVALRLDLQRRVSNAWVAYALAAERSRIQREHVSLLKLANGSAVARVQAGAQQQDLLRSEVEQRRSESELRSLEAELAQMRAMLNAMMARSPDAALRPSDDIPARPPLVADDASILALAGEKNPALAALSHRLDGREDALELARLQYIPDFNPFLGVSGTVAQTVGLAVSIPTFLPEVRAMVDEAKADLRELQAMYRQTTFDQAGQVVAALHAMRNSERQALLFEDRIMPAARRTAENARASYATGTSSFSDLIEAQRVLLDVRLVAAEARAARETSLADLEALMGVDLEPVAPPAQVSAALPQAAPLRSSVGEQR
jgi:outer membrane protein TolC